MDSKLIFQNYGRHSIYQVVQFLPGFNTSFLGRVIRHGEAQLLARVIIPTRVSIVNNLVLLGEDLDAVQPVALLHLLDDGGVVAGDLVHADDGVQPPVGHVQVSLNKRKLIFFCKSKMIRDPTRW